MEKEQIQLLQDYKAKIEGQLELFKNLKGLTAGQLVDNYDAAMAIKKEIESKREKGEICGEKEDRLASTIQKYLELYRGLTQYVEDVASKVNPNVRVGKSLEELKDSKAKYVYSTNIGRIENVLNHRPYDYQEGSKEKSKKIDRKASSTTTSKKEAPKTSSTTPKKEAPKTSSTSPKKEAEKTSSTTKSTSVDANERKSVRKEPEGKNSYLEGIEIIQDKLKLDLRKGFTYGFYKKLDSNYYTNRLNELESAFIQQYGKRALENLQRDPEVAAKMIDVRTTLSTLNKDFRSFLSTPVPGIGVNGQSEDKPVKVDDLLIRSEEQFYNLIDTIPNSSARMERGIRKLYKSGVTAVSKKIEAKTGVHDIELKNRPQVAIKKKDISVKTEVSKEEKEDTKATKTENKAKATMQMAALGLSTKFTQLMKDLKVKNFFTNLLSKWDMPFSSKVDYHYQTCKKFLRKKEQGLTYQDLLQISNRLAKSSSRKANKKTEKTSDLMVVYTTSVESMNSKMKSICDGNGLSEEKLIDQVALSAEGFVDFYNEESKNRMLGVKKGLVAAGILALVGACSFVGFKLINKNKAGKDLVVSNKIEMESEAETESIKEEKDIVVKETEIAKEIEVVTIEDNFDTDKLAQDLESWRKQKETEEETDKTTSKTENQTSTTTTSNKVESSTSKKDTTTSTIDAQTNSTSETTSSTQEEMKEDTKKKEETDTNDKKDSNVTSPSKVSNLMVYEQEFTVKEGTRGYSNMYNLNRGEKSLKPRYSEDHIKNAYKVVFLIDDRPVDVSLSDTEKCEEYLSQGAEIIGYLAVNEYSYDNGKINPSKTECFYDVDDIQVTKTYGTR